MSFPSGDRLERIVKERFGGIPKNREDLVAKAISQIDQIRTLLKDQPGSRPPGTSEFLDFMKVLWQRQSDRAKADLENLANNSPLLGILLKTQGDQELYRKSQAKKTNG